MSKNVVEEAISLLRDEHLVWSTDMHDIRLELASLLEVSQGQDATKFIAEGLAKRIMYSGLSYKPNWELR